MRKSRTINSLLLTALVAFTSVVLLGCGSKGDATTDNVAEEIDTLAVLQTQLRACSRLNVAEYRVRKIVTHKDEVQMKGKLFGKDINVDVPFAERKIAIPIMATVKASINMQDVELVKGKVDTSADGSVQKKQSADGNPGTVHHIEIFLPQPEVVITETHIDHDGVKQMVPFLRKDFTDEERLVYERKGRDEIEQEIRTSAILQQARRSAANQLIPIVEKMGYNIENITITFRDEDIKIIRQAG